MNSKRKGAQGERELASMLRFYGYEAMRSQQYSGALGDADVIGLPGIHIECKRVEKLNIEQAMIQARDDSYADSLKHGYRMFPAVFHRANKTQWKVTMDLSDWIMIYKEAYENIQDEGRHGFCREDH